MTPDAAAVDAEEPPSDLYHTEVEGLVDGFRYELCGECGGDLDRHLIGPDPLGKPHAWCVGSTDPEQIQRLTCGDSNDEEIEALQEALECALLRWPEVPPNKEEQ